MSILITSANPLGLRALGSGGRTAVASFEQITRTLRQSLGPDHAALFAEPSPRGAAIDWFAEAERGDVPVRLTDAEPDLRERGLARLDGLVRDIEAKAVSLRKSDRQDERILGEMLTHALDIPGEDAVFMIGERPVMTFWGYVRDSGQPAVKPLHSLLLRRRAEAPVATPPPSEAAAATGEIVHRPAETPRAFDGAVVPPRHWPAMAVPAILWTILTLLLLTCGVELLRGCAVGFPHRLTGWLLDYCPASADTGTTGALAAERDRQAQLQAEYDELVRQAALARQACQIKTGKGDGLQTPIPKPVTPVTPLPSKDKLRIPDKADAGLGFLEGCWRAHEGLTETRDGVSTGKKLKVTYCFNKDGTGSRTLRYEDDGTQCRGAARARLDGEKLVISVDDAPCEGAHGSFASGTDDCRRGDEGVATCDEVSGANGTPNFTKFPFTRTTEPP